MQLFVFEMDLKCKTDRIIFFESTNFPVDTICVMSFGIRAKAKIILSSIKISYYYMIKISLAPSHHRKEVKTTTNFLNIVGKIVLRQIFRVS